MHQVVNVTALPPSTLRLALQDGRTAEIDIAVLMKSEAFAPLSDPAYFARAEVDEIGGVFWPNGADLSPEYLEQAVVAALEGQRW